MSELQNITNRKTNFILENKKEKDQSPTTPEAF
jgi:hypothetical protein